jgi:hypothetical protein
MLLFFFFLLTALLLHSLTCPDYCLYHMYYCFTTHPSYVYSSVLPYIDSYKPIVQNLILGFSFIFSFILFFSSYSHRSNVNKNIHSSGSKHGCSCVWQKSIKNRNSVVRLIRKWGDMTWQSWKYKCSEVMKPKGSEKGMAILCNTCMRQRCCCLILAHQGSSSSAVKGELFSYMVGPCERAKKKKHVIRFAFLPCGSTW